ncbi:MAG TPA: type II CAAX endopeptidase family protein [Acidimicrobiia bacterium]|nr:type II CAAX endopeptidase family protein [Acidimicrobiia bacterium]
MRSIIRRHQLAAFFVLAFALSWWPWPVAHLNPESVAMIPWGPAIAAVIVSLAATGRSGFIQLIKRIGRWRVEPRWYLAALGIPVAAWAVSAVVSTSFLGASIDSPLSFADLVVFPISFIYLAVVNGPLTEEIGWRGVALPRMLKSQTPLMASLVLGLVWFSWHLPLLVTETTRPVAPFAISLVSFSVVLTWLHLNARESLLIAIMFHAAVNTVASFVVPTFAEDDRIGVWWVFVVAMAITAALVARSRSFRNGTPTTTEMPSKEPATLHH